MFSRFPERLQHAIANLGFTSLRPVQVLAGEAVLDGKNAVVLPPNAGGKTEAAIFPILAGIITAPTSGVGTLYVAPIKALLNNQEVRLGEYTEMVGQRRFVWHGDAAQSQKETFTRDPAVLLMTTPESLEVVLGRLGCRCSGCSRTCATWSSTRFTPSPAPTAARTG